MRIGIDLGGSHIGVGLIEKEKILMSKERNFNREDRENFEVSIIKYINLLIEEILRENNSSIQEIELIGIANPIPSTPEPDNFILLIPTTSPLLLTNAPPLFPELIAASV